MSGHLWILCAAGIALGTALSATGAALTHSSKVKESTKTTLVVGGAVLVFAAATGLVLNLALRTHREHTHAARDLKLH